jgi:hypothetical protein
LQIERQSSELHNELARDEEEASRQREECRDLRETLAAQEIL